MWLIVGLGNPGPEYEWTRHNCGFLVIDELARRAGRSVRTPESQSLTARVTIGTTDAILVKPLTWMNLSGVAVAGLVPRHGVSAPEEVLVISDDLALPLGRIRIRREGSAGGHNGLKSITARLGSAAFPRLRVGISPEHRIADTKNFVLGEFTKSERVQLAEVVARAADAVEVLLNQGIEVSMSKYN
ncbi:MAG: hypothetical protein RIR52_2553 [Acidobacteriota bacterium]